MAKITKPQLYLTDTEVERRVRSVYAFEPSKKLPRVIALAVGFRVFRSAKSLVKEITRTVKKFCRDDGFKSDVTATYVNVVSAAAKQIADNEIWTNEIDEVIAAKA